MAEFALGLTKTAVDGTLSRVKSAIEEERKLKVRVQEDLVFITGEFQMMQSFLNVANAERANDEVARTWVRQLRDLAFDVEDCVEFVIHLDSKSAWWRRVVPSCTLPPLPLDKAAAEIQQLKARVEELSQRNTRYNLIGDSGSKPVSPAEQPATATTCAPAFHILREVWEAAGKQRRLGVDDLIHKLLISSEDSELQVISLWASAGGDLGTTPILTKAYDDPKICQEFKSRAWVKLMHPFNPDEFRKSLLAQLYPDQFKSRAWVKLVHLMQQVNKEERYLVILEEVSTVVEWEAIRKYLPDSKNGSRIVVSTRQLGVARRCTGEPFLVSEIRRSSDGQSLCALFKERRSDDGGKLIRQVRHRGVISVYGTDEDNFVARVYEGIKNKRFTGVEFEQHIWIRRTNERCTYWCHTDDDFFLPSVACSILWQSYSEDNQTEEMKHALYRMMSAEPEELLERCRKLLRECDCLMVIAGLRSRDEWDQIKAAFRKPIKGCILVITNKATVATYCVDDEDRALDVKELVVEAALRPSIETNKKRRMDEAKDWTEKNKLIGRGSEEDDLLRRLSPNFLNSYRYAFYLGDSEVIDHQGRLEDCSVSVWGIAGVGKSALVRSIYYEAMLQQQKYKDDFVMFSWVDVPDQFNLTDLSRSLLLDFHSDDLQAKETAAIDIVEGQDPIQGVHEILHRYRCLVVIDGLRFRHDWDLIKHAFLPEPNKSCIVVITNEENVATHCSCAIKVVNVKCLQADDALKLFKKVALDRGCSWAVGRGTEETKLTVANTSGLPKAIVAIGQYLFKGDGICRIYTGNENYARLNTLTGVYSWMQSYFDACSDSLKPCIFYLSVFPEGHNIRWRRLLMRWIAEGYSRDSFGSTAEGYSGNTFGDSAADYASEIFDGTVREDYSRDRSGITAEENGKKFINELIKLSIIQQSAPRGVYQVNGIFHGYIISEPMEDNLVFALDENCGLNSQRSGQHLTIRSSWKREKIVFKSIDFSRLRSLTVFGEWKSFLISSKMKRLRVLDLEDTLGVTDEDLNLIVKRLERLKFLSLRGCREITRLPDSLGRLRQLQTLDVRHTSVVTLPWAICKLTKLQCIHAGNIEPWYEGGGKVTTLPAVHEDRRSMPPEEGDGTIPTLPAVHEDRRSTPPEDGDGTVPTLPAVHEDRRSTPPEDGDGTVPALPAVHEDRRSAPPEDSDGTVSIRSTPPKDGDGMVPILPTAATPPEDDGDVTFPLLPPASTLSWSRPRTLVSWLSKFPRRQLVGVKVHARIRKLTALHSLGIINVSGARGKAILVELKDLTQLRRLKVSGIKRENIHPFFSAISGHRLLESLSVRLDEDMQDGLDGDDIPHLPAIKKLKLYGNVLNLPFWIEKFSIDKYGIKNFSTCLEILDIEMTITTPEDLWPLKELSGNSILRRLCVKLIQDGELRLDFGHMPGSSDDCIYLEDLKIDCSSKYKVTFGERIRIKVLKVRCSSESDLQFAGLESLLAYDLYFLEEVWVMGSYGAKLGQELQQQLSNHPKKPVFKLVQ